MRRLKIACRCCLGVQAHWVLFFLVYSFSFLSSWPQPGVFCKSSGGWCFSRMIPGVGKMSTAPGIIRCYAGPRNAASLGSSAGQMWWEIFRLVFERSLALGILSGLAALAFERSNLLGLLECPTNQTNDDRPFFSASKEQWFQ